MNSARLRARAKMRRAYWLGGGGVNEPTPGKPKYPKDEADKIRDNEDRQMTGEPLETGSDGLHPGDKEVKEKLLRAEDLQERAMKRRAYFQGGGGVNEPTPGKTKYPKEEADKIRDNEDKQMTGTYEMGGTDGMVPGDEPVKKQLLRAKLKARFTKVADAEGALRKDASRWEVFAGDDMILSATGDEIFGDQLDDNWDYLSSKQYGKDVISTIRSEGFDRVAYLLKGAQPPMADPAAAPEAAPADPMAAPPMDLAAPEADPPAEGEVDVEQPKDEAQSKVDAALNTIEEKIAEIREEVGGMGDELVDIDVNVSDKDEGGEAAAPAPMEEALAAREDLLAIEAMLDESADELALISEALEKSEDVSDDMLKATAQALEDSETLLSEAKKKMDKDDKKEDKKEDKEDKDDKKEDKEDKKEDKEDDDEKKEAQKLLDDALKLRAQNRADMLKRAMDKDLTAGDLKPETPVDKLDGDAADDDAAAAAEDDAKDGGCDHGEDCMDCADAAEDFVLESDESLKEARRRDREQLVAEAADKILGKYELDLGPAQNATEPKYFDAHPGGKGTVTELTHTKTDGAKVETISEVHDVMRDVAESGPRNVREAAMLIQEQIVKGAFKAEDLERLVAEGKVDSAAASYWKKYWAQGPDTGSFGADLSKEFSTKKKESSDNSYKVKIRRAYDLGIVAQEKGIIGSTRAALDKYVDEVMEFDDAAFESTKRIVANMADKSAGSMPRVGVEEVESKPMTVTASDEAPANTLAQLSSLGWK